MSFSENMLFRRDLDGQLPMYEEFLQKVPLFAQLPGEDLTRLCKLVTKITVPAGAELFTEGSIADRAYIIYDGELEIIKHVDGREVSLDQQTNPGTIIGEMALLEEGIRLATVRARRDSSLLMLDRYQVRELMDQSPTAARVMLQTLARRSRALEANVRHIEKMAQLGTLAAGMAHELNNPVAVVSSGAGRLQSLLSAIVQVRVELALLDLSAEQEAKVAALDQQIQVFLETPLILDPLTRSDRETAVENWLDNQGIVEGWAVAPALVELGMEPAGLDDLAGTFSPLQLPLVLRWLESNCTLRGLLHEIMQSAGRITTIVRAMKSYVYLDQAPIQNVDIQTSLEDTLVILKPKITPQIHIRREYAPHLAPVSAYGRELNQVWTNILDNAIGALPTGGEITIRTRQESDWVNVEIEDNGPGIDPAHLPRIFDAFFTTKPPGRGSGLGLNVSYFIVHQHQGTIDVESMPGRTVFRVQLPLHYQPE